MPVLCDVSFLLPLCHGQHEHHMSAKRYCDTVTAAGELVICRVSQLALLRLLSNPVVMVSGACTSDQAWQVYDIMMSDERFVFKNEPLGLERKLQELTAKASFSHKLWQDAYLAAFAMAGNLGLVTFDADFKKFKPLDCKVLK